MKLLVIGNQDAVWGFALTGIHGQVVTTVADLRQALDAALADEEIGIVLVTEDAADLDRQRVEKLMLRSTTPLIVELPGPQGPNPDRPSLNDVIRRTIGVKI
ncbi:MAG: Vacuolar H+transporting two-sector ATPase F subunit [Chloroflexi bacterium]|nr:MAG: Vacuolar H+transporting two-sector ATPase F subunit [Chloroflexota bacterium]